MSLMDWWSQTKWALSSNGDPVRALQATTLEPRMLLSAVAPVDGAGPEANQVATIDDPSALVAELTAARAGENADRRELVLVDRRLPAAEELLALLEETTTEREVLWIEADDSASDITEAIQEAASGTSFEAVHLFSHGDQTGFDFGSDRLTANTVGQFAETLTGWRDLLSVDGDFLIYGCQVAETSVGRELIGEIAELTGADLIASDDLTGASQLGGDWELEFAVGSVETASLSAAGWNHVLATNVATFQQGVDGYDGTEDSAFEENQPDDSNESHNDIFVQGDAGKDEQGYLKFDNIFGTAAGQIPLDAVITDVTLTLDVKNDTPGTVEFHQLLSAVNDTDTWNDLGNGIQRDDVQAVSEPTFTLDATNTGPVSVTDPVLVTILQDWLDGTTPNHGFAIFNDNSNDVQFYSSDDGNTSRRPQLSVSYSTPPPVITVTNSTDTVNGSTTSMTALLADDGGDGISLREALLAASATNGRETIEFDIGTGLQTIILDNANGAFASIADVTIDATTQPGYTDQPLIMIDGTNVAGAGLSLQNDVTVNGLSIVNFSGAGIDVVGGNNVIRGSWIGVQTNGTARGNGGVGIGFYGTGEANNVVGGVGINEGNIVANNGGGGIYVDSGTDHFFRNNALHGNGGLGNVIMGTATSSHDWDDDDSGQNGLLNQPAITAVVSDGADYRVQVSVQSKADTTFTLDLLAALTANSRESLAVVAATDVTTNGDGYAVHEFVVAAASLPAATDAFSAQILSDEGSSFLAMSVGISVPGVGDTATAAVHETTAGNPDFRGERRTSTRAIAVANDGKQYVVWTEDDGGGSSVFGRLFNADGTAASGRTQLNTSTGDHEDVSVSVDANGRFVVAWAEAGDQHGKYRQIHADGSVNGGEKTLWGAGAFGTTQRDLDVESLPTGEFYITYSQTSVLGTHLYYIGYDADGGQTTAFGYQLDGGVSSPVRESVLAINKDGIAMVAWEEDDGIHLRSFNAITQTTLGNDTVIAAGDDVAIAALPDGRFILVTADSTNGTADIIGQFLNVDGTVDGAAFVIDEQISGAINPTVSADSTGRIAIAYDRHNSNDTWYKVIDSTGATLVSETDIPVGIGSQSAGSVAFAPQSDTLWLVWQGDDQSAGETGVWKRSVAVPAIGSPNTAPVVDIGGPYTVQRGSSLALDASGTTDGDGHSMTYSWDLDNDGLYDDATGVSPTVAWATLQSLSLSDGVYTIGVEVNDGNGGVVTDTTTLTIANTAPVADAGGAYAINRGAPLALNASGSSDANGDSLTYRWDLDNDGLFEEAGEPTGATPSVNWSTLQSFGLDADGVYTIGIAVSDAFGGVDTATTTLTLVNDDPIVNLGGPYTINEGDALTLDVSTTFDPNGDTLTFQWDLDNDGDFDEAGEPNGANPTVSWANLQSMGINDDGVYTVGLRVDDGYGGLVTTSATVTVDDVGPTISVNGTGSATTASAYTLSIVANDPGDDTISEWVINWGDGHIQTVVGDPGTVTHIYNVAGLTHNVSVAALNEDGNWSSTSILVGSDSRVIYGPDGLAYASRFTSGVIEQVDPDTHAVIGTFVTAGSGTLGRTSGLAFGPDGNLYVGDFDNDRIMRYNGTTGQFIDAFVMNGRGGLNGPSEIKFGSDGHLYVASSHSNEILRFDGATGDFIDEFVTASDGGLTGPGGFEWGLDGHLYVASTLTDEVLKYDGSTGDFLSTFISSTTGGLDGPAGLIFGPDQKLYVADVNSNTVRQYNGITGAFERTFIDGALSGLTSPWGGALAPDHQVTVGGSAIGGVTDADGANNEVSENAAIGVVVGVTASATDPDGLDGVTYSLDDDAGGRFVINATTGVVTTAAVLDHEADAAHSITVRATSSDTSFSTNTFVVDVLDTNERPTITGVSSVTIADNTTAGVPVATFPTSDPDDLDVVSWSILETAPFSMTGNELVVAGPLDNSTYTLTIRATDVGGLTDDHVITVNVSASNTAPTLSGPTTANVAEDAGLGSHVAQFLAADADVGDTLTYSLIGTTPFTINATTGEVTVASTLDFDSAPSHTFTVQVADAAGAIDTASITVSVSDVDYVTGDIYRTRSGETLSTAAQGDWWDTSWSTRQRLQFENLGLATQTDVPIAIVLNSANFDYGQANADGSDLRFVDVDGQQLDFEVETWNAGGDSVVWVRVPEVRTDGTDYIDVYYGNATATDASNPAAVFSNGYEVVYHLGESGSTLSDSGSGIDLTNFGTTSTGGVLGNAQDFSGANQSASVDDVDVLRNVSQATISSWVRAEDLSNIQLIGLGQTPTLNNGSRLTLDLNGGEFAVYARATSDRENVNAGTPSADTWYHVVGVVDYAADTIDLYVDGALIASANVNFDGDTTRDETASRLVLGAEENAGAASPYFNGQLDEVRIANVSRDADWVALQYATQSNGLINYGAAVHDGSVAANDVHAGAIQLVSNTTNGSVVLGTDGHFWYTADVGFVGTDSFEYRYIDGAVVSETVRVELVVETNHAPTVTGQTSIIVPETAAVGTVLETYTAADIDFEDIVSFSVTGSSAFAIDSTTGELTVAEPLDFHTVSTYSLTVQATDNVGLTTDLAVTVNVTDVNRAPNYDETQLSYVNIGENAVAGTVIGTYPATDPDVGDVLIYSIVEPGLPFTVNAATGELSVSGSLDHETVSSYRVTIRATDAGGLSDDRLLELVVDDVNDAPVAVDDSATVNEDRSVHIDVLVNDLDQDGDNLTVAVVAGPSHGVVVVNADNTITYTPEANYHGLDSVTYEVSDGAATSTATVSIVVAAVNDAPTLAGATATVEPDAVAGSVVAHLTHGDIDGDHLTFSIVSGNSGGAFAFAGNDGQLVVANTAALDPFGTRDWTLVVEADDGTTQTTATVTISLGNSAPLAADELVTVNEDGTVTIDVLANDVDPDSDAMTTSLISGPANGALVRNPDGSFVYTPSSDFNGVDSFTYEISDGVLTAQATATITVASVNDRPVVNSQAFGIPENSGVGTVVGTVLSSDIDGDAVVYSIAGGTHAANFTIDAATGELTVADAAGLDFEASANYDVDVQVRDASGATDTASISVELTDVDEFPILDDTSFTVSETVSTGTRLGFVTGTDLNGQPLQYAITGQSVSGAFKINANTGALRVKAPLDFETMGSTLTVTVSATSPTGLGDTATVTITLVDGNDIPTAGTDRQFEAAAGETLVVSAADGLLRDAVDQDGNALSVVLITGPERGDLELNADGSFTFHSQGTAGDSFVVAVTDGVATSDPITVTIPRVIAIAPPPASGSAGSESLASQDSSQENSTTENSTTEESSDSSRTSETADVAASGDADGNSSGDSASEGNTDAIANAAAAAAVAAEADTEDTVIIANSSNDDDDESMFKTVDSQSMIDDFGNAADGESDRLAGNTFDPNDPSGRDRFDETWVDSAHGGINYQDVYRVTTLATSTPDAISESLDKIKQDVAESRVLNGTVGQAVGVAGSTAAVGYVVMALRSGALVTGLLAQMPAWRVFDPLVVLDALNEEDDESLESMIEGHSST